jgi:DNA-binding NtrC family response regulator
MDFSIGLDSLANSETESGPLPSDTQARSTRIDLCESYDWPGNVPELQNIFERGLTETLQRYEKRIIEAAFGRSKRKVA